VARKCLYKGIGIKRIFIAFKTLPHTGMDWSLKADCLHYPLSKYFVRS